MFTKWLAYATLAAGTAGIAGYCLGQSRNPPVKEEKITSISLQHFDKAEEVAYPFGWIRWLMSRDLDGQAEQTFGIVEIKAHQKNALHLHPNCEELLYVLSGSCEHLVGDQKVVLHPGDLLRVPRAVRHQAVVLGDEPLRAVISYSSADRQVVNLGETKE